MVQTKYGGLSQPGEARGCGTLKSLRNEYSWNKRVSRKRIGCDCVRRAVDRGGRRRAIQPGEVCRRISCCGDSLLLERIRIDAGGSRPRGSAPESIRTAGDKTFLCDEDAVVRARADESAREVHGDTRSAGWGV